MRDAERIEAQFDDSAESQSRRKRRGEPYPGASEKLAPWRFKPGNNANPGGRPKRDMAAIIAQAVFENNPEVIYKAYAKALRKGGGFTFQVLSDRAYGKLKESLELSGNVSVGERLERAKARRKGNK